MASKDRIIVEVMYPYSAAESNQISLKPGERISVEEKDKSGWWIGKKSNGDMGIFPSTYVKVVEDRPRFNRPMELKQLPLTTASGLAAVDDKNKKLRQELGFDSDSGDDTKTDDKTQKYKANVLKLQKTIEALTKENTKLREAATRAESEKEKLRYDSTAVNTQLSVLRRQLASAHEKERRLQLELEDWKAFSQESDKEPPKPRVYSDSPDEALQRWLDAAVQDSLKEQNKIIASLRAELDSKEIRGRSRRSSVDEDFDDGAIDLPDGKDENDSREKEEETQRQRRREEMEREQKRKEVERAAVSPSPTSEDRRERPDKHDVVKLSDYANDLDGCIKPGDYGTVVEDQGDGAAMPFRVRNAAGVDSWYTESCLVIVSRGKRKAGDALSPKNAGSDEVAVLKEELKDKNKKLKKIEKKAQVLEEDLAALEKYNTKLEKRLEKEKAKKAGGTPTSELGNQELLNEIAELKEKLNNAGPAGGDDNEKKQLLAEIELLKKEGGSSLDELTKEKEALADKEAELIELKALVEEGERASKQFEEKSQECDNALNELKQLSQKYDAANAEREEAVRKEQIASARAAEIEGQMSEWTAERDRLKQIADDAAKKMEENDEHLKFAVERYKKEEKRRRELYNQLMELKGNIRVYCRVKPSDEDYAFLEDDMTLKVKDPTNGKVQTYEFDKVFPQAASQVEVFEEAKGLAVSVLDGYYVCIFAYGQTGSGKTYTMEGPPENRGVNFRTVSELFKIAKERETDYSYNVSVSVLEVYNDKIYDLQNKRSPVKVSPPMKGEKDVTITPLTRTAVMETDQVVEALEAAYANRSIAGTSMNEHSSRSHCVLSVWIEATNKNTGQVISGKLHLVDLAGSERLKQSEVEGERKVEATHINKSLTQLGLCINSLANKKDHIPFRNSQLTTLLQDSLGGNCKCLMFANVSPKGSNVPETISTLKFATNAAKVELGKATKNVK
eukprot:TRINITY_DN2149_c0_g1_i1.p1 TRINITY_DN2149_c0_g1~~TRINITY_DN2149_c0_g1_i1.p1  ORF type:complete len:986 (+),score=433.48 TRINITY_DN2149_c0_g1_i1:73-2958(+)